VIPVPSTMSHSCIYEGKVHHRRLAGPAHAFSYRLFLLYLDLAEIPTVFSKRWLWSAERANLVSFHRRDHFGDPAESLEESVRSLVEERTGDRPTGPVRLLTQARYFGYVFNPVSFFYCWDATGDRIHSVVAEVSNTPWGERHLYVVRWPDNDGHTQSFELDKEFHVSPFFPMEQSYRWNLAVPGEGLSVHMENIEKGEKVFDVSLALRRREFDTFSMASQLLRHPAMTATVVAGIYFEAARLWAKGAPFHPRENSRGTEEIA
jgi:DUF1365 family protein